MMGCFSLFVYDSLLTLDDEIKYIWRRRFNFVSFAYLISRYYAMCNFILQIVANFSVAFDISKCKRYVPFQMLGQGIPLIAISNMIIGLRVYALYGRNKYIAVILPTCIIAEISVSIWVYSIPSIHPVTLPGPASINQIPVLHLCLGSPSDSLSNLQSAAYLFMQAIFDSITFGLLVFKTAEAIFKERDYGGVRALIVKNGLLYYAIVFSAWFTWAMMIVFSPPGLKYAAANPTTVMTCLSVSRLTLSLRAFTGTDEVDSTINSVSNVRFGRPSTKRRRSWIGTSTFEITEDSNVQRSAEPYHDVEAFELLDRCRVDGLESSLVATSTIFVVCNPSV